jgi:hypothetical protein
MSESFNVQTVSLVMGSFAGATEIPLYRVPTAGGGITVLEATAFQNGGGGTGVIAGTAIGAKLITFGTVNTSGTAGTVPSVNGTICNFAGTLYTGAGTVHVVNTMGTAYVAPGYFIGYDQTAGTLNAGLTINIAYVLGK